LQRSPDHLAELKGRGGERGGNGKWEREGREGEMEEEGEGRGEVHAAETGSV